MDRSLARFPRQSEGLGHDALRAFYVLRRVINRQPIWRFPSARLSHEHLHRVVRFGRRRIGVLDFDQIGARQCRSTHRLWFFAAILRSNCFCGFSAPASRLLCLSTGVSARV